MNNKRIRALLRRNTLASKEKIALYLHKLEADISLLKNISGLLIILTHNNTNPHLIASVIHLAGLFQKKNSHLIEQLIHLKTNLRTFLSHYILNMNADEISISLQGIARLKIMLSSSIEPALAENLNRVLLNTADKMNAQQISKNLVILTSLGLLHSGNFTPLQDSLLGALTANVRHMTAIELSNVLGSLTTLKLSWNDINRLLKADLLTGLNNNSPTMSALDISKCLFALASLQASICLSQQAIILELFNQFFKLYSPSVSPIKETKPLLSAYSYFKSQIQTLAADTTIELLIKAYKEEDGASKDRAQTQTFCFNEDTFTFFSAPPPTTTRLGASRGYAHST